MKKIYIFLLAASTGVTLHAQDYWLQKDSVNGNPKSVCASFAVNGEGFILSGLDYVGFSRKVYSYNVTQNDWDTEQSIGGINGGGLSRGSACAFTAINMGYICLGQGDNTNFLDDMWEYDPAADIWAQKADFPGTARRNAVAFVIDDIAYIGTGEDASGLRKDFYKYDPVNNIWGYVSDFAGTARKQAVGFSMGNQGYVGTGYDGTMRNDFWQYLVFQNMWVQKANFPGTPRSGATGWGIFPCAYIATGEDNTFTYRNDVWEYNYFSNQWIQRASLPSVGRKNATSFVLDGVAYLGTGYNGDHMDDFYAYYGIVGVEEAENHLQISLYPNPVTEGFTLSLPGNSNRNNFLKIYSVDGRDISSGFMITGNENGFDVKVGDCSAGCYFCAVCAEDGRVISSKSFIIQ